MIGRFCSRRGDRGLVPGPGGGSKLASYCLTEPGAGSDAASLRTRAERDGDDYVISGSKVFISGAGDTDVLVVMLRTGAAGPKGITALLVPADVPGISYGKKEEKMGWNAQPTRMITFDGRARARGQPPRRGGAGLCHRHGRSGRRAHQHRHLQRGYGPAGAAGSRATTCRARAVRPGDRGIPGHAVQASRTCSRSSSRRGRWCGWRRASSTAATRRRPPTAPWPSASPRTLGFRVCNEALQLFGGYGYIREYPMERHVRDTRVHQILEGTNEIMRVIIARRLMMDGALEVIR
jgi:hypothetical protein